jgi:ATP-dependent helicase/DNAse subunit B
VLAALKQRNLTLRAEQLRSAARRIAEDGCAGVSELLLAGFYSFTAPELEVVHALAKRTQMTVALAEWAGAQPSIDSLAGPATSTRVLPERLPAINRVLSVAPTLDTEVAEIARRIVQAHDNGRPWREMGVLVRSEATYVPALRSAFARLNIPARFYFSSALANAAAVRYLSTVMDALLSGWDHETTLAALRLPGAASECGPEGDRFEFDVLGRAPGAGLESLRAMAGPSLVPTVNSLDALTPWLTGKAFPATWASRMRSLRTLFLAAELRDQVPHENAMLWRSHAAALNGFESACDEAASVLEPAAPIDCRGFWDAVQTVLASCELRVPDHRRDVVHVIDAFEARQWSLPVVFVCGLLEKEFPRYQSEDPLMGDAMRRRLQSSGVHLRTSEQRQSDEKFLFHVAISRASEALILSYPQLNAKGEANLPSFFLQAAKPYVEEMAADVRPTASRTRSPEPAHAITSAAVLEALAARLRTFSPTGIETYLQCPYQFFASRTLRLQGAPEQPWDRLNNLVQGSVIHAVLERADRERRPVAEIFEEEFEQACAEAHVPEGYRTEAIRLELLSNLEMIAADSRLARGVRSLFEEPFSTELAPGITLKGTIDRLEVDANGIATVIDYKYRSPNSIAKTKKGHEEKVNVQGGLYLIGAASKGYQPEGMVYCGLRREISFAGWMLSPHHPGVDQACGREDLDEMVRVARETTIEAVESIRAGAIAPKPADEMKCGYCAAQHTCRYEVAVMRRESTAGAPA